MTNGQRQTVSPRIARMLRELEGPPSDSGIETPTRQSGSSTRSPAHPASGRRVLVRAVVMASITIVAVLAAMQARAPAAFEGRSAFRSGDGTQHLTDAGPMTQSMRDVGDAKAK
jgi:hypothetical protein